LRMPWRTVGKAEKGAEVRGRPLRPMPNLTELPKIMDPGYQIFLSTLVAIPM